MEINLMLEKYQDARPARQKELDTCLDRNIANSHISKIWLFGRGISTLQSTKICPVETSDRLKFNTAFEFAAKNIAGDNQVCIIANSDIYFDDSLSLIKPEMLKEASFALSRWDVLSDGAIRLFNHANSADSWFFTPPLLIPDANFHLGLPGCDNRLAYLLQQANRSPSNPSHDIKTYHLHLSGVRNYTERQRVPSPYLLVYPTSLAQKIPSQVAHHALPQPRPTRARAQKNNRRRAIKHRRAGTKIRVFYR